MDIIISFQRVTIKILEVLYWVVPFFVIIDIYYNYLANKLKIVRRSKYFKFNEKMPFAPASIFKILSLIVLLGCLSCFGFPEGRPAIFLYFGFVYIYWVVRLVFEYHVSKTNPVLYKA